MTYVLIWLVSTSGIGAAMVSGSIEFQSEQACETARQKFDKELRPFPGTIRLVCLQK